MARVVLLIYIITIFTSCFGQNQYTKNFDRDYCHSNSNTNLSLKLPINGSYSTELNSVKFTCFFYEDNIFAIAWLRDPYDSLSNQSFISDGKNYYFWGSYYLKNDTIHAIWYNQPNTMSIGYIKINFIIKEQKIFYVKPSAKQLTSNSPLIPLRFYPLKKLPNAEKYAWMKRKKWFWCDEAEYKKWMAEYGK